MAEKRDEEKTRQSKNEQATGGQQSHQSEYGGQGDQSAPAAGENVLETSGSTVDLHQGESAWRQQSMSGGAQADLGSQAGSTLAGRADQQDLGQDQPGSSGEGFIGTQERSQPVSEKAGSSASAKATGGTDFAVQGRGAPEEAEDEEEESGEGPRDVGSGGLGSSV